MMIFRGILLTLLLLTLSCGEPPVSRNLVRAQISDMNTTVNGIGTFVGDQIPNMQQDNLDPGEYTIQFQVIEPPIDGLGFAAYAYIVWKVQGQQIQRIVNVFNGAAISGVADAAHVKFLDQSGRGSVFLQGLFNVTVGSANFTATVAQTLKVGQQIQFLNQPNVFYTVVSGMAGMAGTLDRPYTGTPGLSQAFSFSTYKIGATLSRGTRPTTMQPAVLLTRPTGTCPPGAQFSVNFPPVEAGVLSILASATVDGLGANPQAEADNGQMRFVDATGVVLSIVLVTKFPAWYPVPPGAVSVTFLNGSATKTLDFSFQWGIEG